MDKNLKSSALTITWCLLIQLLFYLIPVTLHASETILNFSSTIFIQQDASITVTEDIRARCEGRAIRHGIYRDIPVRYSSGPGPALDAHLKIIQVKLDGRPSDYHTRRKGAYQRIYIGRKHYLLPHGVHSFEITYTMKRMIGFFGSYDELYWNVTGDKWKFPIEAARARIILPADSHFIKYASYTGRHGSKENNAHVMEINERSIAFETLSPILPGEGLTIAASWPPGLVERPGGLKKLIFMFMDNVSVLAGMTGIVSALFYFFFAWNRAGRDPEKGPIIPRYEPPRLFGPAAARFITKMGFDNDTFSAAIINLAVKGYLLIKEKNGEFTLLNKRHSKRMDPSAEPSEGEKRLYYKLFRSSDELRLTQEESSRIRSAVEGLKNSLKASFEKIYFRTNSRYLVPGIIITVITMAVMAIGADEKIPALFITVWLSAWSVATAFLDFSAFSSIKAAFNSPGRATLSGALKMLLFALPFNLGLGLGGYFYILLIGYHCLVLFFLLLVINITFYQLMKAPTMRGRKILDEIEGFRMFLKTAEKDRLNILTPPEKIPELFEKYLPWAVALGVENQWADTFQQYLADARSTEAYSPSWYAGSYPTPVILSSSLGHGLTSAITSSSVTRSSSSGSGGGGFSGGGGGGGGGGGW